MFRPTTAGIKMDTSSTTTTASVAPLTTTTSVAPSSTSSFEVELNVTVTEADYFYQVEQLTFLWVLFTLIVIGELKCFLNVANLHQNLYITANGRK